MKNILFTISLVMLAGLAVAEDGTGSNRAMSPEFLPVSTNEVFRQMQTATLQPQVMTVNGGQAPMLQPVAATLLITPDGEVVGFLQADALSFGRDERTARQRRRAEIQARRANMSAGEKTADHLQETWPWYAGGLAALVTLDRVSANNDWLWHKSGSSGGSAGRDLSQAQTATVYESITAGGNITIITQQPQGSGSGMQANTGSGGLDNPVTN